MKIEQPSDPNITAYPKTEEALKEMLAHADINVDSFSQRLSPCSLSTCQGMCCYDGVYVGKESAQIIQEVVEGESQFFKDIGLQLPEEVIVQGEWEGVTGLKTAVKSKPFSSVVENYPSHFNNTACVFLMDDARCGLQVLSEYKGLHPWYYKPFTCWLHPIGIDSENNQHTVVLYNEQNDPCSVPNYPGYTTQTLCGKIHECGQPAYKVLEEELRFLGRIAGRNYIQEIKTSSLAVKALAENL